MSFNGPVRIEPGAIQAVVPYLKENGYRHIAIVADDRTYEIAGRTIENAATSAEISVRTTLIQPDRQGDVIADEASLIQLILDLRQAASEIVIAVGSGTLHDIARFSAYAVGIPFVSVPTAPSVDGFNSVGAPLIIRGEKKTIGAIGPSAIFADLDILTKAPSEMIAAGFGDMLGKYTSLFDWKFGSLAGGEPYSEEVADRTKRALQLCVDHCDEIGSRSERGIEILTRALIESGFAMLQFGQSHPASGAEHHLSHYWEMELLRSGRRQVLHGAKVGIACGVISDLYHRLAADEPSLFPDEHRDSILEAIRDIPSGNQLRELLTKVGGPTEPDQLGIDSELLKSSLREAHHIRPNRFTLLKAYNERK
ncbi:sn-glycerol-1-phosphate dehydrogenase [Cohnella mopanensis]|uniref:sn-glycerol-1-phosphate dehydrogenase n=1 Tax=Cohnella mopanensis TaxID=2911966 RepID=UPI001EF94D4F|nr:sn-glycerol-1-phosphate dehydrogenase [Cohnella mopanensis]